MKIVVIGGTGRIGSKVVARLRDQGHEVVAAARQTGVDVLTGAGVEAAMVGAQIVVDLANSPSFEDAAALHFFQTAGPNILAAEAQTGVAHHVALSVVGTEKHSASGYFRAKLAQETLIRDAGIPYTIVHSTQFFEFLPDIIQAAAEGETIRLSPAHVQPIASEDVADAVARIALQPPANGIVEIAGPERESLCGLAQRFMALIEDPREVVSDVHARYFGAELEPETLMPSKAAWKGVLNFDRWLELSDFAGYDERRHEATD
jgi:uncharacterized protein YbjT (DUF2867 family)